MIFGNIYNSFCYYFNNIKYAFKIVNLIYFITCNDIISFNNKQLNQLKLQLIDNGAIAIKFMQWFLSKKISENDNGDYDYIIDVFNDLFDNCPHHSLVETEYLFLKNFNCDMKEIIDYSSLKVIGSGSIGQVYKAKLINGEEIAMKVRHPSVSKIIPGQMYIINLLIYLQKFSFTKNLLSLHIDIDDFMYNLLLQLDFTNEVYNTLKFRKNFYNNTIIVIPEIFYFSKDIIISKYEEGQDLNTLSLFQRQKAGIAMYCFIIQMTLFDNFIHGDLHKKNWCIRKLDNSTELQLVVYDFGLCFRSDDVMHNRNLWSACEDNDKDGLFSVIKHLVKSSKNVNIDDIYPKIEPKITEMYKESLTTTNLLRRIVSILKEHDLYLKRIFLNLIVVFTLIEKILVDSGVININQKTILPNRDEFNNNRDGDVVAYTKKYPFYSNIEEYYREKYNRMKKKSIFNQVENTSTMTLVFDDIDFSNSIEDYYEEEKNDTTEKTPLLS